MVVDEESVFVDGFEDAVTFECPCGETGKDGTLNHNQIVSAFTSPFLTNVTGGKDNYFPVCENHVDNYKQAVEEGMFVSTSVRQVPETTAAKASTASN